MSEDKSEQLDTVKQASLDHVDTTEIMKSTNEAIAVFEMRRALMRQAERDLVIEEMHRVIDLLVAGHVAHAGEIEALQRSVSVLVRQQQEVRERQDIIAAVCDVFAKKLEEQVKMTAPAATEPHKP